MSLEAILTVITVVLAILALIPQERVDDLRIRLGGWISSVVVVSMALVVYWSLLEPLHSLPGLRHLPRPLPWLDGWDPASSSLAVLLATTVLSWWKYGRQVSASRIPKLATALATATARRRLGECVHLLDSHLGSLRNALTGNYWQARLRTRLRPTAADNHLKALTQSPRVVLPAVLPPQPAADAAQDPEGQRNFKVEIAFAAPKAPHPIIRSLSDWAERPRDAATEIVRSVSLAPGLVAHIAEVHPYLGLALLHLPSSWLAREFADTYARTLLSDPESVFYRELRRAQNMDHNQVPVVDTIEQPLLSALCEDSMRPDGPRLLYTFLEVGIDQLRLGRFAGVSESLNGPIDDYHEKTRWTSAQFATIYLIAIVGPRNAVAPNAPPLNLFVLRSLVDRLLHRLSPTPDVDSTREWPTPIHQLLYEAVSLLVDLVTIWRDRPGDLPPSKLSAGPDGRPSILSAHAIDVLSSVMYAVLRSDKLEDRFKAYLLEVWWSAYWEKYRSPWAQTSAVLESLVRGGGFGQGDMAHRGGMESALTHVDIMRLTSEGGDNIRAAFELPARQRP